MTQIIISICSSIALPIALTYLLREWISTRIKDSIKHEYDRKIEEFKAIQQKELEGYKAGYQKFLDENRVRFNWWHERQANAIQETYAALIECKKDFSHFFKLDNNYGHELNEKCEHIIEEYDKRILVYEKNQIFFDNILNEKLSKCFDLLKEIVETKRQKGGAHYPTIRNLARKNENQVALFTNVLSELRAEFKGILIDKGNIC